MYKGQSEPSSFIIKISKWISDFFNPLTSLLIYFIYFSYVHYSWQDALHEFLPILLILVLPVSIWIVWNVKKGSYSNMDVSNRNQRKSLYFVIAVALIVYLIINYFLDKQFDITMFFLFLLLIMMQISNYFIKSSMHTALNVYAAALFFSQNEMIGILWLGIAIVVGITRIILKRHTPKEVMMGALLAIIVSFMYLYTNIQIHH